MLNTLHHDMVKGHTAQPTSKQEDQQIVCYGSAVCVFLLMMCFFNCASSLVKPRQELNGSANHNDL